MASPTRLMRPLPETIVHAIAETGYAHVGGPVARVVDLPAAEPGELLDRWQLEPERAPYRREQVYLLTFDPHPLMQLQVPSQATQGELAVYATGFLRGSTIVPVWLLTRTWLVAGATVWRLTEDQDPEPVLRYLGSAAGWRGAKAYRPPTDLVCVRADVGGGTYSADLAPDGTTLDLVVAQREQPAGFEASRPSVWHRSVPVAAASRVWDMSMSCVYEDVACRVIDRHVDVGVFELEVPRSAIQLGDTAVRELPTPSPGAGQ